MKESMKYFLGCCRYPRQNWGKSYASLTVNANEFYLFTRIYYEAMSIPMIDSRRYRFANILTVYGPKTSLNYDRKYVTTFVIKQLAVFCFMCLCRDRIRTCSNLTSHTFCAAVTYQFCKEDLKRLDKIGATEPINDIEITVDAYKESHIL